MKVIIGDVLVNTDHCSVLDTKTFTGFGFSASADAKRHVLRDGSMPICDFPDKGALKNAMNGIKLGTREGFDWIELNPESGNYVAFGYYLHSQALIDQLSRLRQRLHADVQHYLACGAWPEDGLPAQGNG